MFLVSVIDIQDRWVNAGGVCRDDRVEALRGIDPAAKYEVKDADTGTTRTLSGKELMDLRIEVPAAPGSTLLTYRKLG